MRPWKLALAAVVIAVTVGCEKKEAEVPKNPVPMEKPGQGAEPPGGRGGPKPGQASEALPK